VIRSPKLPRLRSLLLILGVLAVIQLMLATYAFVQTTYDDQRGFAFPGPERVRALVAAIEGAPPALRRDILRTFEDGEVDAAILPGTRDLPQAGADAVMPGMEAVIGSYLASLGQREVIVWIAPDDPDALLVPRLGPGRLWSRHPLRMAVQLERGEWLLIETRGNLAEKVFGFPPGLWAGLFGVTLALLSLGILWRSLAPLGGLGAALDRFAADPVPQQVRARGPEETRRIIEAVNRMQEEISRFIAERQVMFGALSHDLRTGLTRLSLRIGSLPDEGLRDAAERDLARMNAIVEDALVFTRLDTRQGPVPGEVALAELVHELRSAYPAVPVHGADDPALGAPNIVLAGDGPELFRALQNLIENALTHAKDAEVLIACERGQCRIDVMDRGSGLAGQDRDELVKPFVRGKEAAARNRPGAGLGLAIVQRIAIRCGGTFAMLDRPGGGTIARLALPRR